MAWKGGIWVGGIAIAGGAAIMTTLVVGVSSEALAAKPTDIAKVAAFGVSIALIGAGWIRQSQRDDRTLRCSFCTNVVAQPKVARCEDCQTIVHVRCADDHARVYHPKRAQGFYR